MAKPASVPPLTTTSPASNPLTTSPKLTDTGIDEALLGLVSLVIITGVGAVRSLTIENCVAAKLLLPAKSSATSAATSTVIAPSPPGVTLKVNV